VASEVVVVVVEECSDVAVVAGADVSVVDATTVVGATVVGATVVVVVVVVDEVGVVSNTGAATLSGDTGLSVTWASAALTICQVSAVVNTTTAHHPPIKAIIRID
jgi:hypothetical protein